jgi:hypothetical protein
VSLYHLPDIVILVGLALILVFFIPWRGRPPRNRMLGYVGFAMVVTAALMITLRLGVVL